MQEVQPPQELWPSPVEAVEGAALDERLGLVCVCPRSFEEVREREEGAARPASLEQPLGELEAHPFDERETDSDGGALRALLQGVSSAAQVDVWAEDAHAHTARLF